MNRRKQPRGPTDKQLLETLHSLLPDAPDFRDDQKPVIDQIMRGRDVLAIMPTGGGKSVCYQVPAMHLSGITLVISPLLALMEDQVKKLHDRGFPAACLSSAFIADRDGFHRLRSTEDKAGARSFRALRNQIFLAASRGEYKLLYVTPERLRSGSFIRFAQKVRISMIAVDEAHCLSLWGYDFRPRYLEISRLLTRIGYHPIIAAFTATATKSVREDIVKLLGMTDPTQLGSGFAGRDNLSFSVRHIPTEHGRKKRELLRYLRERDGDSGFVYCSSVFCVNEVFQYLTDHGIAATRYYADLDKDPLIPPGESKQKNFHDFLRGKKTVMVSTTALGMGIDKDNIRFVIHYNLPICLENYYQEAGRAGRDGKPAECILYYSKDDIDMCHALIQLAVEHSELSEKDQKLYLHTAEKRLGCMRKYAERGNVRNSEALQKEILNYFGTFDPHSGEAGRPQLDVIAKLKSIDVLYVNRTKIAQELRKGRMEGENLSVGKPYPEQPVPAVSYRVTGEALNYFDLMVADAVYTLMKHRVPTIYAKSVMELLSGNENLMLRPERKADVENSIRKMIRAEIVIDRRDSARYGFTYDDQRNKLVMRGAFLPLYEKKSGFGYDDGTSLPLYEYAEIINGQFFSFPTRYLRVKDLPTSAENLAMTHYLLCRIHMMTAPYKRQRFHAVTNHNLRFDTMLHTLGIELPDGNWYRNRKAETLWKSKMIPILRHLQAADVIKGFDAAPEKGSVTLYRFMSPGKQEIDSNNI